MKLRLEEEFIKIIDGILYHIFDYTEGYFELGKPPKDKKAMERFLKRSFEGLKKAQNEIIKQIIDIEKEIKKIKEKESILFFKRRTMQELANSIAFLIFGAEWVHFKPFMHKNMNDGFLEDRNVESCIEFAKEVNKDPIKFAFINDLSSALGFADITEVSFNKASGYSIKPIEIKTGKKNIELIDVMRGKRGFSFPLPEKDLRQMKRISNEIRKTNNFTKYKKSDLLEGQGEEYSRAALDFQGEPKTYIVQVMELLDNLKGNDYKYVHTDFGIIQICTGFGFAKEMDLKHYAYHTKNQDWEECDYVKTENLAKKEKNAREPIAYARLEIFNVIQSLAYPTLEPMSAMFGREKTVDIVCGRKSIYVYFDYETFSKTLEKKGLKTKLVKARYLLRKMKIDQKFLQEIPKFDNKFLVIFNDKEEAPLTFGFLFKMVYKFLSAEMIAEMFLQSQPK